MAKMAYAANLSKEERAEYAALCEEWLRLALDCDRQDRLDCLETADGYACLATGEPIDLAHYLCVQACIAMRRAFA